MKAKVTKSFDGKRFIYKLNGGLDSIDKREFKYACIATTRQGKQIVAALGNNSESTLRSNAKRYREWCTLEVIEIENE